MNIERFPEIAKTVSMSILLVFVLHCGGENGGGNGTGLSDPQETPHMISGAITSSDQWEGVPGFEVRYEGTRDEGGYTMGSQALYPCDFATCDCAGNCTYEISAYDGTYEVWVYVAPEYGERVIVPPMRVVVVEGADITEQDFAVSN